MSLPRDLWYTTERIIWPTLVGDFMTRPVIAGDQSSVEPADVAKASRTPLSTSSTNIAVYDRHGFDPSRGAIAELSTYALEPLRKDAEFVLYRGRRGGEPSHILVLAPASEEPA